MKVIVEMIFGSHLYGTNTPNSDQDFKGVFMPTAREIALQRVPHSIHETTKVGEGKNTPQDLEKEFYSLHHFLHLAHAGETVALDMLHAPFRYCVIKTSLWEELSYARGKFYTKNLRAFVGYARRQAAKYGVKGSRLAEAKTVLEFFKTQPDMARVGDVWEDLPTGEHIRKHVHIAEADLYEVCGKKLTRTAFCCHYIPMLEQFIKNYGDRARQAEQNAGIDWKAVSHAFRAGYQVKHILLDGGYTYPLPETEYLIKIKLGQLNFLNEVRPALNALMDELEILTAQSTLPEEVDRNYWDNWLVNVLRENGLV